MWIFFFLECSVIHFYFSFYKSASYYYISDYVIIYARNNEIDVIIRVNLFNFFFCAEYFFKHKFIKFIYSNFPIINFVSNVEPINFENSFPVPEKEKLGGASFEKINAD